MADARTTLSGQGIAVGGGYGSSSRRDPSGHERVQAQRAEAGVREQEARRLGTWKEGVGIMSKQQLASEARDKALFNQNVAAQNKRLGINQPDAPQISATDFVPANRINVPAANARGQAEMARQMAAAGGVGEQGSIPPTVATPLEGVVKIAPQYRVKGESPFGYAGTPEYKEGQMVRATSSPITRDGRQTGIQGASNNNWQQAVVNKYNDIGVAGTPMNRAYVQAVKAQTGEFDPMKLAESVKQTLPEQRNEPRNGPPIIEITDKNGNVVERRPIPGPGFRGATPIRDASGNVTGFGPRDPSGNAPEFQPTTSSTAGPIVATQTPTAVNRQNWFDRALSATPKEMSEFEARLQAQQTLPGQMAEVVKHPIAALRTYFNTDTTPSQVTAQATRQEHIVNPAYERAGRARVLKGDESDSK